MSQEDYSYLLVTPNGGEVIDNMTVKVRSADLGGDFSIMQARVEPHQLLVPHTHTQEDQAVFVIEGELEFEVGGAGGTRFRAIAGSYVIKPRAISHGFWNATDRVCHYIELSGRNGFENFVDDTESGALAASREAEGKYGLVFHKERVPELLLKHGLTSVAGLDVPWEGAKPPPRKR